MSAERAKRRKNTIEESVPSKRATRTISLWADRGKIFLSKTTLKR